MCPCADLVIHQDLAIEQRSVRADLVGAAASALLCTRARCCRTLLIASCLISSLAAQNDGEHVRRVLNILFWRCFVKRIRLAMIVEVCSYVRTACNLFDTFIADTPGAAGPYLKFFKSCRGMHGADVFARKCCGSASTPVSLNVN